MKEKIEEKQEIPPEEREWPRIQWYKRMSKQPFFIYDTSGDEIEVVIKHRFTIEGREMLFIEVLRNITRPHITFPQPFLP